MSASPGPITRYADAWTAGDVATMFDLYADDIVVHYGGTSEFAGTHHGKDRLIEIIVETAMRSVRQLQSIDQVDDHGTHGALFVTEQITVAGEPDPVLVARALRYRASDDRLTECWLYDHDQHLVDRSWTATQQHGPSEQ